MIEKAARADCMKPSEWMREWIADGLRGAGMDPAAAMSNAVAEGAESD
jgi:hypothetical protein